MDLIGVLLPPLSDHLTPYRWKGPSTLLLGPSPALSAHRLRCLDFLEYLFIASSRMWSVGLLVTKCCAEMSGGHAKGRPVYYGIKIATLGAQGATNMILEVLQTLSPSPRC